MRTRNSASILVVLLILSLLGSLILMSGAIQNSNQFGALYPALLLSNSIGILALMILIGANIFRLLKQLKAKEPGARLTLRMVVIFTVLAVVPVTIVYSFSLDFLRKGVDSWFDLQVSDALSDSLELSRESLELRTRQLLKQTEKMAEEMSSHSAELSTLNLDALRSPSTPLNTPNIPNPLRLDQMRSQNGAEELIIMSGDTLVISSSEKSDLVPSLPSESIQSQVMQGQSYIGLNPSQSGDLFVRIAVKFNVNQNPPSQYFLHAIYPFSSRINSLTDKVETAYAQYNELSYLREKLTLSFAMTLTLVLLFSIAAAVWAAFYSARRFSAPIRDLAAGTAAVARGDYTKSLPVQSNDEIGFLVGSFNSMTNRIARARNQVEMQREYLDTLLSQLSSGVMALTNENVITTLNPAAVRLLNLQQIDYKGGTIESLCRNNVHLNILEKKLIPLISNSCEDWQTQGTILATDGSRELIFKGTKLKSDERVPQDSLVIVIEDVTAIIQGQRDAAWSEVARRLAHEIKNPLTPIQLATERLRLKYLTKLGKTDSKLLEHLTRTIIQQVETMKTMVNSFSEYANVPIIRREQVDLGALIEDILDFFKTAYPNALIECEITEGIHEMNADPLRLRQVFNNLIKNALEASPEIGEGHIIVTVREVEYIQSNYFEILIADYGTGIPEDLIPSIFEPYVTNKNKGSGLGLAIVKKIVEEHHGVVSLKNKADQGVLVTMRFPITKSISNLQVTE